MRRVCLKLKVGKKGKKGCWLYPVKAWAPKVHLWVTCCIIIGNSMVLSWCLGLKCHAEEMAILAWQKVCITYIYIVWLWIAAVMNMKQTHDIDNKSYSYFISTLIVDSDYDVSTSFSVSLYIWWLSDKLFNHIHTLIHLHAHPHIHTYTHTHTHTHTHTYTHTELYLCVYYSEHEPLLSPFPPPSFPLSLSPKIVFVHKNGSDKSFA